MTNALVIFNFETGDSSCPDWKEAFLVKNFSPYDVPRIRKALEKSDAEADYYDIAVDALSHLKMDFADFEFSKENSIDSYYVITI